MKKVILTLIVILVTFSIKAQNDYTSGQTKLINPTGRTLLIEKDDDDSWLTFHDPGNSWYSIGIDKSNSNSFSLNYGGDLNSSQFVMNSNGNVKIGGDLTTQGNKIRFSEARGFDYDPTKDAVYFNDYNNGRVISFGVGGNIDLNGNLTTKGNKIRFSEARGFDYDPIKDAVYFNDYNNGRVISFGVGGNIGMRGKLTCSEVKVQIGGGADFVFANDYKLPTLEYVESFIKENNHLPEIAPAHKMKKNGIYLAEMNIKLLQKIEELTLYTIQQQKEIKEQNSKLEKQENDIAELKSLFAKLLGSKK